MADLSEATKKNGDLNADAIEGDDNVITNNFGKTERRDDRYSLPEAKLVDISDEHSFEKKVWPIMGDNVDERATNALGHPVATWWLEHKAQAEAERKAFKMRNEQARREEFEKQERERQKEKEAALAELVTVEELEQIRKDAYDEGHAEGLAAGHEEGFAKGQEEGMAKGIEQGLQEGASQGYEQGFAQGREDGFKQGHAEGVAGGESIVLTQVERFRHLADHLANPLREVDRDVTDELIYMVSRLVKVMIGREIKQDTEFLRNTIQKALTVLPNYEHGATIALNSDDAALMEATIGREYMQSQKWQLKADPELKPGDVAVTNEATLVQWRVDQRIDSLLNEFLSAAAPCVDQALREEIPDAPSHDATLAPLSAPQSLEDLNLSDNAPEDQQIQAAEPDGAPAGAAEHE